MALMSLRSRSHVKASVVNESRSFIHTQLYKITSKYYFKTHSNDPRAGLEPATYCLRVRRLSQLRHAGSSCANL